MADLRLMNSAEKDLIEGLAEVWPDYGRSLRDKHDLDGGMQWKFAKGHEYLTRYRQDPETGKKKWSSLGRRSPETEAVYAEFMGRRANARETIQAHKDDITLAGRLARARGLTRLPTRNAEILRSFWLNSVDTQITLFCGASLLAYERDSRVVGPGDLVRDDRLMFVFDPAVESVELDGILDIYQDVAGGKAFVVQRDDIMTVQVPGGVGLDFVNERYLMDHATDRDQASLLSDALRAAPFRGLTIASDGQPVELKTFAPQSFAMMAYTLGQEDEVWAERAEFAGALVRECWEFDADQEAAFPGLGIDPADAPPRM
jgi:hypothetical protein